MIFLVCCEMENIVNTVLYVTLRLTGSHVKAINDSPSISVEEGLLMGSATGTVLVGGFC